MANFHFITSITHINHRHAITCFLLIDICYIPDLNSFCISILRRSKAEGDRGECLKEEEDGEGEEVNERLEKEDLELVRRSEGGRSGTKLTCLLSKTCKSNFSRVLAKRVGRLAQESSPVGRSTWTSDADNTHPRLLTMLDAPSSQSVLPTPLTLHGRLCINPANKVKGEPSVLPPADHPNLGHGHTRWKENSDLDFPVSVTSFTLVIGFCEKFTLVLTIIAAATFTFVRNVSCSYIG